MKYKDKIYFLDDILEEMEKDGHDKELVKKIYYYYRDSILQHNSTTNDVVYRLGSLGYLYYTIGSCGNLVKRSKQMIEKAKKEDDSNRLSKAKKYLEIAESKWDRIQQLLAKAKELGVKRVLFYRTRFNLICIKNEEYHEG